MNNYRQSCLLLNKPSGMSSNEVLTKVKKKINQKKSWLFGNIRSVSKWFINNIF